MQRFFKSGSTAFAFSCLSVLSIRPPSVDESSLDRTKRKKSRRNSDVESWYPKVKEIEEKSRFVNDLSALVNQVVGYGVDYSSYGGDKA